MLGPMKKLAKDQQSLLSVFGASSESVTSPSSFSTEHDFATKESGEREGAGWIIVAYTPYISQMTNYLPRSSSVWRIHSSKMKEKMYGKMTAYSAKSDARDPCPTPPGISPHTIALPDFVDIHALGYKLL